jgi:outer membrane protein
MLAAALTFSFSAVSQAKDLKIGYVDIFKVFNDYKKTIDYDKTLEGKKEDAEKKLDAKKETIKKIKDKLSLLKEGEKAKEEAKMRKEAEEYQELQRKIFIDIKKERDEKMQEIIEDINKIVEEYAKKNKFDMVINQNAILYGDRVMDITDEILKISNQQYKR